MIAVKRLGIVGSSGHAAVIADALAKSGVMELVGFLEKDASDNTIFGRPVLGPDTDADKLIKEHALDAGIIAIGDNAVRRRIVEKFVADGIPWRWTSIIHPGAIIAQDVEIGPGTFIAAGAIIGPRSRIGAHCIVNTGAQLDHDCCLEDYASVAPGVVTGGNCRIGQGSVISIGAILKHGIKIGAETVVGAGAVVLQDAPDGVVVYGNPARVIRQRRHGDQYL
jgi:sugar O-acyltransferase (sialic acid O-acetyltransferase NeuD family)